MLTTKQCQEHTIKCKQIQLNLVKQSNRLFVAEIKKKKDGTLIVDGVKYTPYTVNEIPMSFGFKSSETKVTPGYSEWFNYKGITYIIKK